MYDGEYNEDIRHGYGTLKEIRGPTQHEGSRYCEYFGMFENDRFHGKGRFLVYDSKKKLIKFEEHEGYYKDGMRDGLGKHSRLKDSEVCGDEEDYRKDILYAKVHEYVEFVGDFFYDKPVYHSGVLKHVKIPVNG